MCKPPPRNWRLTVYDESGNEDFVVGPLSHGDARVMAQAIGQAFPTRQYVSRNEITGSSYRRFRRA